MGLEAQANGLKCLFSDKIVGEAKITNNVEFLSINGKTTKWAEEILKLEKSNYKREDMVEELQKKEKDVKSCVGQLEKIYSKLLD